MCNDRNKNNKGGGIFSLLTVPFVAIISVPPPGAESCTILYAGSIATIGTEGNCALKYFAALAEAVLHARTTALHFRSFTK